MSDKIKNLVSEIESNPASLVEFEKDPAAGAGKAGLSIEELETINGGGTNRPAFALFD